MLRENPKTSSNWLKPFEKTGWVVGAWATFFILISLLGGMYYTYFSNQKEYFRDRNFRLLVTLGHSIQQKFEDYQSVFDSAYDAMLTRIINQPPGDKPTNHSCFSGDRNILFKDWKMSQAVSVLCQVEGWRINRANLKTLKGEKRPKSSSPLKDDATALPNNLSGGGIIDFDLTEDGLGKESIIKISYQRLSPDKTTFLEIIAEIDVAILMKGLPKGKAFDNLILADPNGNVIFQDNHSQYNFHAIDVLFKKSISQEKEESKKEVSNSNKDSKKEILENLPGLKEISLAGEKTLIFFQALNIPFIPYGKNFHRDFILLGHVSSSRFLQEAMRISYMVLLLIVFALLVIFFSLPLLKIYTMDSKDRVKISDVLFLLFTSLAGMALLTFLLLDLATYRSIQKEQDVQLSGLSESIHSGFKNELDNSLKLLKEIDSNPKMSVIRDNILKEKKFLAILKEKKFMVRGNIISDRIAQLKDKRREIRKNLENFIFEYKKCKDEKKKGNECGKYKNKISWLKRKLGSKSTSQMQKLDIHNITKALLSRTNIYNEELFFSPGKDYYYDSIFGVSKEGQQLFNWTVGNRSLPVGNLGDRAYVKRILHGQPWHAKVEGEEEEFFLEPIYSRDSGKFVTVVSVLNKEEDPKNLTESDIRENKALGNMVLAIELKLLSLVDPVIPDGFQFAVIETLTGAVQFHSDRRRNLRENFYEETDQSRKIRALAMARGTGYVNGKYQGEGHRLYIRPLHQSLPWTLVVLGDLQPLHTAHLETITVASVLFLGYAGIILVLVLLALRIFSSLKKETRRWIWPNEDRKVNYRSIAGWNFSLAIIFLGILVFGNENAIFLYSAFIIPLIAIGIMWGTLNDELAKSLIFRFPGLPWGKDKSVREVYVVMVMSFTVILGMVPAIGLFTLAHKGEMELFTRHIQHKLLQDLDLREQRVRKNYQDIELNEKVPGGFIHNRLGLDHAENNCGKEELDTIEDLGLDIHGPYYSDATIGISLCDNPAKNVVDYANNKNIDITGAKDALFDKIHSMIRVPYDDQYVKTSGFPTGYDDLKESKGDSSKDPFRNAGYVTGLDKNGNLTFIQERSRGQFLEVNLLRSTSGWLSSTGAYMLRDNFLPFVFLGLPPLIFFLYPQLISFLRSKAAQTVLVISSIPMFSFILISPWYSPFGGAFFYIFWVVAIGLFFGILYALPRFISERILLLDFEFRKPSSWTKELVEHSKSNLLIIVPPTEADDNLIWNLWENVPTNIKKIDIRAILQNVSWYREFTKQLERINPTDRVVVTHFEYGLGVAEEDRRRLHVMEDLFKDHSQITAYVVSCVDPLPILFSRTSSPENEKTLDTDAQLRRWENVFHSFLTIPLWSSQEEKWDTSFDEWETLIAKRGKSNTDVSFSSKRLRECLRREFRVTPEMRTYGAAVMESAMLHLKNTNQENIEESNAVNDKELNTLKDEKSIMLRALELGRPSYEYIWFTLSEGEKLALYQLSEERFLNSENPELGHLLQKKLITLNKKDPHPDLQFMNESFRHFVHFKGQEEDVFQFEEKGSGSLWKKMVVPLGAILVIVGIALVSTQEELQSGIFAMLALLPALLPVLPRIMGFFQGSKGETAPS